jgi:hypothetical protein
MRRTIVMLLAAFAVLAVAAGGVTAADVTDEPAELTPADDTPSEVQADDGDDENTPATHPTPHTDESKLDDGDKNDSDGRMWIPEDQNRDGEIDDRFKGNDSDDEADVGVCMIGVDSPCNGEDVDGDDGKEIGENDSEGDDKMWIPEDQNRDGEIDERFKGNDSDGEEIGDDDSDEQNQIWIPEDQNRDGEIDDRFRGGSFVGNLLSAVFGLF